MKQSKKMFLLVAMVLCLSLCIGTVSHAEPLIKYTETNYGRPISDIDELEGTSLGFDSSGRLVIYLFNYKTTADTSSGKKSKVKKYARIKYDSNGKKKINTVADRYNYSDEIKYVYGSRAYGVNDKKMQLIVYTKKGKVSKRIKLTKYLKKKYLKRKKNSVYFDMAEIVSKSKVRIFYFHKVKGKTVYGGLIEVNPETGNIRELVGTDKFIPRYYDGKYVYNYTDRYHRDNGEVTFYRKSIKTKKTEKFKADEIAYDSKKYTYSEPMYSIYNGGIMAVEPGGKVFYATFDSKQFEQIGDISSCKYFNQYEPLSLEMKSRDEFYISYCPSLDKDEEPESTTSFVRKFIVRYKK